MLCSRCSGLLVCETFGELRQETARLCQATRCINCGSIEDSLVRANRLRSRAAKQSAPRGLVRNRQVLSVKIQSEECGSI